MLYNVRKRSEICIACSAMRSHSHHIFIIYPKPCTILLEIFTKDEWGWDEWTRLISTQNASWFSRNKLLSLTYIFGFPRDLRVGFVSKYFWRWCMMIVMWGKNFNAIGLTIWEIFTKYNMLHKLLHNWQICCIFGLHHVLTCCFKDLISKSCFNHENRCHRTLGGVVKVLL